MSGLVAGLELGVDRPDTGEERWLPTSDQSTNIQKQRGRGTGGGGGGREERRTDHDKSRFMGNITMTTNDLSAKQITPDRAFLQRQLVQTVDFMNQLGQKTNRAVVVKDGHESPLVFG